MNREKIDDINWDTCIVKQIGHEYPTKYADKLECDRQCECVTCDRLAAHVAVRYGDAAVPLADARARPADRRRADRESVVLTDRSVVVVDEGSRAAGVEQERRCCLPCWREEDDGRRVRGTAALCSAPAETERGRRSNGGSSRERVLLPACFRFARGEREPRSDPFYRP